MKIKKMKLSLISLVGLVVLLMPAFFVSAQEVPEDISQELETEEELIADIEKRFSFDELSNSSRLSIYDTKILSQKGNNIKVAFDIVNGPTVQSEIKYVIQLIENKEGLRYIVDEKISDELLDLREGETVHKEVEYSAPDFLQGQYELWTLGKKPGGLTFGIMIIGNVSFMGSGEFVRISPENCHLFVEGEDTDYATNFGVDVSSEEKLMAKCSAKSNLRKNMKVIPVLETYERNTSGNMVSSEKLGEVNFNLDEEKEFVFEIPKEGKPQAYDAVLRLEDENGKTVSSKIAFHYVVRGASATIQNVRMDKDRYLKEDTAKISLFWTPSADIFENSRSEKNEEPEAMNAEVSVFDSENNECSKTENRELIFAKEKEEFNIPIIANCQNPQVLVVIKDSKGTVLDKKIFGVEGESKDDAAKELLKREAVKKQSILNLKNILIGISVIVIIIVLIYIFMKKRGSSNTIEMGLFLGLLVIGGMFTVISPVLATHGTCVSGHGITNHQVGPGCVTLNGSLNCGGGPVVTNCYYGNLNGATFYTEQQVTVCGTATNGWCSNGNTIHNLSIYPYRLKNGASYSSTTLPVIDELYYYSGAVSNNCVTFTAPSTPGTYSALWRGLGRWSNYGTVTWYENYNVIAGNVLNVSVVGPGSVGSNPAGISCNSDCSETYNTGTNVTLTPYPATISGFEGYFVGWSGDGDCLDGNVTMNASKSCTATFEYKPILYTATNGTGTGRIVGNGIDCSNNYTANPVGCGEQYNYPPATNQTITATEDSGMEWAGWQTYYMSGGSWVADNDCSINKQCNLNMSRHRAAVATFNQCVPSAIDVCAPVAPDCSATESCQALGSQACIDNCGNSVDCNAFGGASCVPPPAECPCSDNNYREVEP